MDAKVPQPTFGHDDLKVEVAHVENHGEKNDQESYVETGRQHGQETDEIVYVPGTAEEKALVRKMDMRLLPILWLMYVMTVPIYVVAIVISLSLGWNADRTNQKAWHIVGACAMSALSFIICATVKKSAVRYMVTNFEGREKRAVSIAIINGFGEAFFPKTSLLRGSLTETLFPVPGNLASVYGSFLWPSSDAPLYHTGFGTTTGLIALGGVVTTFIRLRYGNPPRLEDVLRRQQDEAKAFRIQNDAPE
ncbi:hypothetical protein QFC22_006299 [Naganishia vaughanmartiniae]|uniref:Uncharacterized protein n=1 Tax=Naganishia vaughanmartiniae TaxID=1424756 RepID=A0ACC2WM29_9TREE|nr:hypothetical protein QFC22_006299 [Naganishia vaughanmartiniae]